MEVEFDSAAAEAKDFGLVKIAYTLPETGARATMETAIRGRFSDSKAEATASLDERVFESVVEQSTRERAQQAIALRDQGKQEEAAKLFQQNVAEIDAYSARVGKPSAALQALHSQYGVASTNAKAAPPQLWNEQRKLLFQLDSQGAGAHSRY
jgi:Ca-activated chloride channel family protein